MISMPDSTDVAALPDGYLAYLGYVDGALIPPTCAALAKRFPAARRVCLTTTGGTLDADGCDIETGDLTPASGAFWTRHKLTLNPESRPVLYASVGTMPAVLDWLSTERVNRNQVRLLSAHYGKGPHICGPATCREISIPMDGTQWTDRFLTAAGTVVDMSELADDFFTLTWTERIVQELPTLAEGATGDPVKRVQALCSILGVVVNEDGIFGPNTKGAVVWVQQHHGLAVDGVVGPLTWPVLLGIA